MCIVIRTSCSATELVLIAHIEFMMLKLIIDVKLFLGTVLYYTSAISEGNNIIYCVNKLCYDHNQWRNNVGQLLTANLDNACPGQTLIYTCVSRGTSQRWTISIFAESSPLTITLWSDSDPPTMQIHHNHHYFNFTLVSTDYHHFSSTFSTTAIENLHSTQIECASVSSMLTTYITINTGN